MHELINEIFDTLNEEKLQAIITNPINRAVNDFTIQPEGVDNHQEFIKTVGDFFQHLYKHGLRVPRYLTETEAREEALWFLEKNYKGEKHQGYDAAFEDAVCNRRPGLTSVLGQIAAIIKDHERENYIYWILTRYIDPSDWHLRMQLAEEYLKRYGKFWPEEVITLQPFELAQGLQGLLQTHISSTPTVSSSQLQYS